MWSAVEIRDADATKRVGREGIAGEWVRTGAAQTQFRDDAGVPLSTGPCPRTVRPSSVLHPLERVSSKKEVVQVTGQTVCPVFT